MTIQTGCKGTRPFLQVSRGSAIEDSDDRAAGSTAAFKEIVEPLLAIEGERNLCSILVMGMGSFLRE